MTNEPDRWNSFSKHEVFLIRSALEDRFVAKKCDPPSVIEPLLDELDHAVKNKNMGLGRTTWGDMTWRDGV